MNHLSPDLLAGLAVRLSTAGKPLGSGFLIAAAQTDTIYVLTARHCVESLMTDQPLDVDFYDSEQRTFIKSATAPNRYYFDRNSGDTYDVAVLPISRSDVPIAVRDCLLVSAIPKKVSCVFRGFPDSHQGKRLKEIDAETSFPSGTTTDLKVIVRPENNETSALANVKGLSGSGVVCESEEQLTLLGIVTHYDADYNTYTAHNLSRVNELLDLHDHPRLSIAVTVSVTSTKDELTEPSFIAQNQESLRQAEALWKNLLPRQALTLVELVRTSVEESNLPTVHRNPLLAKVYYLKALAEGDLDISDDANMLFIQAYNLHKEKKEYRERAAAAYFYKDNRQKAYELTEELLSEDEDNPRAWAIMNQLKPALTVPDSVQASCVFKVGQIVHLAKANEGVRARELATIFARELQDQPMASFLDRSNLYYWDYVAQTAMHYAFEQSGHRISLEKPREYIDNPLLAYARDLFDLICSRVHGTDFQEREMFRVARFNYCVCQYFITDDASQEKRLVEELYRLFIGEQTAMSPTFLKGRLPVVESMPKRLLEVLVIFLQQKPQLVIDAVTAAPKSELDEVHMLMGRAYSLLGQPDAMVQAYRQYLTDVDDIDQYTASNCLAVIRDLIVTGVEDDTIVQWLGDGKTFTENYIKLLLEAFCLSHSPAKKTYVKESADLIKGYWNDLVQQLRKALAAIYSDLREWDTAKTLWRELIGEGNQETDELRIYLLVLFEEHQELDELSLRLGYWREHFRPDLLLTLHELQLYRRLNNYQKQAEVAAYGMDQFPDQIQFWLDRVEALHHLGDTSALIALLDDRLLTAKLPYHVRLHAAHIYLVHGLAELGQEACYRVLKENWANPAIKMAYFSLSTQYKAIYDKPFPETAEECMVVRLSAEGRGHILELTAEELQHNPIAQRVIGLHVNESFQHTKPLTEDITTYFVEQILDKYQGQNALIAEELSTKPHNGTPIKSIDIPAGEDPGRLLDRMKEILGPQELKRQLFIEEAKREFAEHKIGFLELAQQAFGGNPVGAWEYITSDHGDGFPVYPLILLNQRASFLTPDHETEFVLDFSALLTLHRLSETNPPAFGDKPFVVSQYTIDYIGSELEKAVNEQESQLSIGYRADRFIPYFHPEDLQERRIKFWSGLRDWVKQNCRPDFAWERLTWEWQRDRTDFERIFSDRNLHASSFWDALLLANRPHRILLTDDMFVYNKLPAGFVTAVTTEWYLLQTQGERYITSLWLDLIRLNMRGLTLTGSQLYQTFSNTQLITRSHTDYYKAQYSFSPRYNPNRSNLTGVITFVKNLYADNLMLNYKRQVSRTLFQMALNGTGPMPENVAKKLLRRIDQEFRLLGNYGHMVKEDICHSLEILLNSVNT